MKKRFWILTILALILVSYSQKLFAVEGKEKFATVDIGKIFDQYEKTKKYDQDFQNDGKSKQEERDAIVHEIRRLRDEEALLSENSRQDKHKQIEAKMKELDGFDEQVRGTLGEKRDKAVKEVFQDIENTMAQYGQRKGYDFIFNERALLYKDKRFDVTPDILKELNSQYGKEKK